jgi:hypothetical protein
MVILARMLILEREIDHQISLRIILQMPVINLYGHFSFFDLHHALHMRPHHVLINMHYLRHRRLKHHKRFKINEQRVTIAIDCLEVCLQSMLVYVNFIMFFRFSLIDLLEFGS